MTIEQLKCRVYDLLAAKEAVIIEIQQINKKIIELSQQTQDTSVQVLIQENLNNKEEK